MKNTFIKYLQNLSIYILKKTKYKFDIKHDNFDIIVQPVPNNNQIPTRYDFICHHKELGFMNYIEMERYFDTKDKTYMCENGDKIRYSGDYYGINLTNKISWI